MTEQQRGIRAVWAGLRGPVKVALAVGVTAVTAATIAIPVIAGLQSRETTTETIAVAAGAAAPIAPIGVAFTNDNDGYGGATWYWLVPADAPWGSLPLQAPGGNASCDAGQTAWLQEHGINPIDIVEGLMTLELRNDATDGSAMTVTNIRADGELGEDVALIWVSCIGTGAGAGPQVISLDYSGAPAVWAEPSSDSTHEVKPQGTIVSVDLAAGQIEQLFVLLPEDQTAIFEGNIIADVRVGSEESVTTLVEGMTSIPQPFAAFAIDAIGSSNTFWCRVGESPNSREVQWADSRGQCNTLM